MNGPAELNAYRAAGLIDRDDVAAAALLVGMARRDGAPEPDTLAWVAICLALRTVRDGHTCVDLARIRDWAGDHDPTAPGGPCWPTDAAPWVEAVRAADRLVGKPGDRRPFILDSRPSADGGAESHRLYLARSLAEEESIATAIRARVTDGTISILLGGPGTGKTTKVAADLVARLQGLKPGEPGPRLGLAAPTGKAAARMTEVLRTRCQEAGAAQDVIDRIAATPARTVHKLLGYNPSRGDRFAHTADNLLPYDLVIVDEASMLSSSLMHHLLSAIDPAADLRLVGDPDQLASVDAGTVLGDIAVFGEESHAAEPLHGCIDTLRKIHRSESANILALAAAIRGAKVDDAIHILRAGADDVAWIDPADAAALDGLEKAATDHARALGNAAGGRDPGTGKSPPGQQPPDPRAVAAAVLRTKARLQVLCAHRDGPMGVWGWNARIEKRLGVRSTDTWYAGRPVIVTRNSRSLGLANGDVGVVVPAAGRMEAVFGLPEQSARVAVSRLEDVETVHALTIHKSQGSEYGHAIVVLPERPSQILTRELLYTGVTRARDRVTVVGSREVIEAAIRTPIRRATGLAERLRSG
jgi:exodeoxyribonuclease V alpha subunit